MSFYQPGEVIWARLPYQDNPAKSKIRPVLVLSIESETLVKVSKITKTNYSKKYRGVWIEHDSSVGKEMGLNCDSFIDLDTIVIIPTSNIIGLKSPVGEYHELDELLRKFRIKV